MKAIFSCAWKEYVESPILSVFIYSRITGCTKDKEAMQKGTEKIAQLKEKLKEALILGKQQQNSQKGNTNMFIVS
jgi:hypothetical protein